MRLSWTVRLEINRRAVHELEQMDVDMNPIGNLGVRRARDFAPSDTGRLDAELSFVNSGENRISITSRTPYAKYVEFGTEHADAQPFLRPAFETPEVNRIAAEQAKEEVRKIGRLAAISKL